MEVLSPAVSRRGGGREAEPRQERGRGHAGTGGDPVGGRGRAGHPGEQGHPQDSYILPLLRKRKKNRQYYICHTINKVNSHGRGTWQSSQGWGARKPPRECTEVLGGTETSPGWYQDLGVHRNPLGGCTEPSQGGCTKVLGCRETSWGMPRDLKNPGEIHRDLRAHRNPSRGCTKVLGHTELIQGDAPRSWGAQNSSKVMHQHLGVHRTHRR